MHAWNYVQATQLMTKLTKRKPDLPEGEKKKPRKSKTGAVYYVTETRIVRLYCSGNQGYPESRLI